MSTAIGCRVDRPLNCRTVFDREIWLAARSMLVRYGTMAAHEAGLRSDAAVEREDFADSIAWQGIMEAILLLQAEKPEPGETVQ